MNEKAIIKASKEIAKSERVITQRVGDRVFITNAYFAVFCPIEVYNLYVRPTSARFGEVEDGKGTISDNSTTLPRVTDTPMKIDEIMLKRPDNTVSVSDTEFLKICDHKKFAHVLSANNTMILVDEKFLTSARAFCDNSYPEDNEFTENNIGSAPIVNIGDLFGYLVLPIRRDTERFIVVEN